MKKIKTIIFFSAKSLLLIWAASLLLESCNPKPACGTKRQHHARAKSVKRMAPSMSH